VLLLGVAVTLTASGLAVPSTAWAAPAGNTVIEVNDNNYLRSGSTYFAPAAVDPSKHTPGTFSFVDGPATSPLGVGSLALATPRETDKVGLFTDQYFERPLRDIKELGYSTYHHAPSGEVANPSLQVTIDPDGRGPGTPNQVDPTMPINFTTLVYEPYLNSTVVTAAWQSWNVAAGKVYSTQPIPGGTLTDPTSPCVLASSTQPECINSFAAFQERNPAATIIAVGVNQGSSNAGVVANVDALYVNLSTPDPATQKVTTDSRTFDFEPAVAPVLTTALAPRLVGTANSVTVSGTVSDASTSTVTISLTDAASKELTKTATVVPGSNVAYSVPFDTTTLIDGRLTAKATAVDNGGNSTAATDSGVKDTTKPTLGGASASPQPADRSVTIAGSLADASASKVTVSIVPTSGGVAPPAQTQSVAAGGGSYSATFDVSGLAEGAFGFRVTAIDDAANEATPVSGLATRRVATSPTGSATPTSSTSATPSGSATTTMSPSATDTASPAPGCPGSAGGLGVRANTTIVNATGLASVTVTGSRPGRTVVLQGYSQNHAGVANFDNDPTPADRLGTADDAGSISFNDLRPASNTRLRAAEAGCSFATNGPTAVIEVRAQ